MKTLADIKRRAQPGVWMTLTAFETRGTRIPHKFLNVSRVVHAAQSNGIYLSATMSDPSPSWLDWPKASEVTIVDENTFRIDCIGPVSLTYKFEA